MLFSFIRRYSNRDTYLQQFTVIVQEQFAIKNTESRSKTLLLCNKHTELRCRTKSSTKQNSNTKKIIAILIVNITKKLDTVYMHNGFSDMFQVQHSFNSKQKLIIFLKRKLKAQKEKSTKTQYQWSI